jgi:hypothetical protein
MNEQGGMHLHMVLKAMGIILPEELINDHVDRITEKGSGGVSTHWRRTGSSISVRSHGGDKD